MSHHTGATVTTEPQTEKSLLLQPSPQNIILRMPLLCCSMFIHFLCESSNTY